jgi:predicted oxidoreductase
VHRPSPDSDVDETLGALTDLVRQGKVRYIGSSSYENAGISPRKRPSGDLITRRSRVSNPAPAVRRRWR